MTPILNYPTTVSQVSEADMVKLSFKEATGDVHYPNSIYVEGRNALLRLALSWEYGAGTYY